MPSSTIPGAKRVLSYTGAAFTQIPAGQTPQQDLDDALDNIFRHPNVAPFISQAADPAARHQQPVAGRTWSEWRACSRTTAAAERGELDAVIKAILLDPEARSAPANANAGKLSEPVLRLTRFWRAYGAAVTSGS